MRRGSPVSESATARPGVVCGREEPELNPGSHPANSAATAWRASPADSRLHPQRDHLSVRRSGHRHRQSDRARRTIDKGIRNSCVSWNVSTTPSEALDIRLVMDNCGTHTMRKVQRHWCGFRPFGDATAVPVQSRRLASITTRGR